MWGNINTPLHEAAKLNVGELPINPLTPNEMRKALEVAAYHSPWVRRAFEAARHEGWSGEDKYTLLAFHMTLENERRVESELRYLMLSPSP